LSKGAGELPQMNRITQINTNFCLSLFVGLVLFVSIRGNLLFAQEESDILEEDVPLPKITLIQQTIEELTKNPIDLNSADYEDLLKIPFLTPVLAYLIIETRKSKDNFKSVSELTEISGIDNELFEKIISFVIIRPNDKTKTSGLVRFRIDLDTLTNITRTDEYEIINRVLLLSSRKDVNLRLNFSIDKDRKEKYWDFLSASASVSTRNNKLIFGNYLLSFGSQLLFAGPFSYINSIKNFSRDPLKSISELSGVYEHSALFGIGISQQISNLGFYSFLSSSLLDAEIKNQTIKKVYYYTKYTDSLSKARHNQLHENLLGLRITYCPLLANDRNILIGATAYHNHYDKPFAPTDSANSFYGSDLNLIGFDAQTKFGNYFLRTEFGHSIANGFGGAMQIIGDWHILKVNFNLYAQQKNFFSPHSRWKELTNRKDKITGSFNIFYNLSGFKMYFLSSTRQDFTTDSLPSRIQYRLERKQGPFQFGLTLKGNYRETELRTYGTRFDISYPMNRNFECYGRFEDRYVKGEAKSGRMFLTGIKYRNHIVDTELRIYFFNINSSDCRLFSYESGNGSYSFNNKGIRIFNLFKIDFWKTVKLNYYLGYLHSINDNFDSGLELSVNL